MLYDYFCQFEDFNNYKNIDYKSDVLKNPSLYKYGPLMDILDALSLGCFFIILEKKV